jgi:hypothetical protein
MTKGRNRLSAKGLAERERLIDMAVREARREPISFYGFRWKYPNGCDDDMEAWCNQVIAARVKAAWPSILSRTEENAG